MRLLIVELEGDGHNMVLYTRMLLREIRRRSWSATLLTTESGRRHPAFDIVAAGPQGPPETLVIPDIDRAGAFGSFALMLSQIRIWRALRAASRANDDFAGYDLIYCINMDKFEKAFAMLGSPFGERPFAGMLTNPKFHRAPLRLGPRSRADAVYKALFKRLLRLSELKCLTVIDEPFRRFCEDAPLPHAGKIRAVPDVGELEKFETTDSPRQRFDIPQDAFVVLLYGSLSRRKGVDQLLRAVESIDSDNVVALVAGRADGETESLLATNRCRAMQDSGRLIVMNGFHDDEAEAALFGAADAVWLGYVGGAYGSSGVLFQAGSARLPVVAMELGLIGWMVREHDAGITLDPQDTVSVSDSIRRLRNDRELRRRYGDNCRRLAQQHTGAEFAGNVCRALESAVGEVPGGVADGGSAMSGQHQERGRT